MLPGLVTDLEDDNDACPLIKTDECTFAYIKHSNVYIVATTRKNSNIAMLFALLHRICQVMQEYFKEVEEESIRDNFVICYELMDEMIDFEYPQTTDAKILQEYITQVEQEVKESINTMFVIYRKGTRWKAPKPPPAVTNTVSWRPDGIKYRKNEVFLDVIESVNLLAGAQGNVLR